MSEPEFDVAALRPVMERLDDIGESLRRIAHSLDELVAAGKGAAQESQQAAAAASVLALAVPAAVAKAATAPAKAAAPAKQPGADAPLAQQTAGVLSQMFGAALMADKEDTWVALEALTHPEELSAPRALAGFIAFSWSKLRRNVELYLADTANPASFRVARTVPGELGPHDDRVKVFLLRNDDMQVPVALRRDAAAGNEWRLSSISL